MIWDIPLRPSREEVLHECMSDYGGFEGNAQTFRILTRLEGESHAGGLNLTRALLLSVMKYPIFLDTAMKQKRDRDEPSLPPKASMFRCDQEAFEWVVSSLSEEEKAYLMKTGDANRRLTVHQTLECSIIDLADDIAYGTHDAEDAVHLGFIRLAQLKELLMPFGENPVYQELQKACMILDRTDPEDPQLKYRLKKCFPD